MALKKLKREVEAPEVQETVAEEESPYMNEDEATALSKQVEADEAKSREISMQKMANVVALVQEAFHLSEGSYTVNAFADKGNKSSISLSNEDFDIVITIKDNEKFGIL